MKRSGSGKKEKKKRSCVLADLHKGHLHTNLSLRLRLRLRLLLGPGSTRAVGLLRRQLLPYPRKGVSACNKKSVELQMQIPNMEYGKWKYEYENRGKW